MAEVVICKLCRLPGETHGSVLPPDGCLKAMERAMTRMLQNVGQMGTCDGCSAVIVWVRHRNGKNVPYTTEGLNHFVNCPARERFK